MSTDAAALALVPLLTSVGADGGAKEAGTGRPGSSLMVDFVGARCPHLLEPPQHNALVRPTDHHLTELDAWRCASG